MNSPSLFDELDRKELLEKIGQIKNEILDLKKDISSDEDYMMDNSQSSNYTTVECVRETRAEVVGKRILLSGLQKQINDYNKQIVLINVKYAGGALSEILGMLIARTKGSR